jgi:hypothetical protein
MKSVLRLVAASALALSASAGAKGPASSVRRDDLIVMGYAKTRAYEVLDEYGMSTAITADLRISKVISGRAPSRILTIRYIAHTDLRDDRELRFHLRRSATATWLVCKQGDGQGYICK